MTPNEYKEFKGLKKENLRDHMNDLNLIKDDLIKYQEKALIFLNLIKLMEVKKFFGYYAKKVSSAIFTKNFMNEINSSLIS